MSRERAASVLCADYRPPIRRGDLAHIPAGAVVAIIDGVFEQQLAISLGEVRAAVGAGVTVFGGASMGALRAAEVPGVHGVGRIYAWYRDGVVVRDDEVALVFDPDTYVPLTVPTVNVRFSVERLVRPGTIDSDVGDRLISATERLPYTERTYQAIVQAAGLNDRLDVADLVHLLEAHDLKREDAQVVLEAVGHHRTTTHDGDYAATQDVSEASQEANDLDRGRSGDGPSDGELDTVRHGEKVSALVWESGDRVTHEDLLTFLCFTGGLETRATRGFQLAGQFRGEYAGDITAHDAQAVLDQAATNWGWMSVEEARVTLADLGIDLFTLDQQCVGAVEVREATRARLRRQSTEVQRTLVANSFIDGMDLKRHVLRLGALRGLACRYTGPLDGDELHAAEAVICRANRVLDLTGARSAWAQLGWDDREAQDQFVLLVARARAQVRTLTLVGRRVQHLSSPGLAGVVDSAPKPPGERRFCTSAEVAAGQADALGRVIGVTRVGMIGELADLHGVHIAQAARPGGAWSSSYGSGKSTSCAGARVGAVLEELEKWAQERFDPSSASGPITSFQEVAGDPSFVDPATLDLPYDTCYDPAAPLSWSPCVDLTTGRMAYLPADVLRVSRGTDDICYTARGGRKHLATNGLGAGFTIAEAALHAVCEYVERHAQRLADLRLVNPGGLGPISYRFVDPTTGSDHLRELVKSLSRGLTLLRVLDITCEVAVPTYHAVLVRDRERAEGYGTHPDPDIAIEMALLEAAQTLASRVAGGREDLSIHARSLGRHERPRPTSPEDSWFWLDPDGRPDPVGTTAGFCSDDVRDDLNWAVERVLAGGLAKVLMADLGGTATAPAHVLRVVVPDLETNNPFYTGPRARIALLPDLVPQQLVAPYAMSSCGRGRERV